MSLPFRENVRDPHRIAVGLGHGSPHGVRKILSAARAPGSAIIEQPLRDNVVSLGEATDKLLDWLRQR